MRKSREGADVQAVQKSPAEVAATADEEGTFTWAPSSGAEVAKETSVEKKTKKNKNKEKTKTKENTKLNRKPQNKCTKKGKNQIRIKERGKRQKRERK